MVNAATVKQEETNGLSQIVRPGKVSLANEMIEIATGYEGPYLNAAETMSKKREVFFIGSLCLGHFMAMAPLGQVLEPIAIIGNSFNETAVPQLSWYLSAYALTLRTFIFIGGGLEDRLGFKRCYLAALSWMGLWSFIAGFTIYTGSETFFDVCRAFQGLGSAILLPNAMAILGVSHPPGQKKAVLFATFGATGANGFLTTSIFAALLAQLAWWPWTFWIYTIVSMALLGGAAVLIPKQFMNSLDSQAPHFDWIGSVAGTTGLILFSVAWNQAPAVGWQDPYVIALLIVGVACLAAFIAAERKAEAPLVPVKDLNSGVLGVLLSLFFGWMSFGIFLYYWWQIVLVIQQNTPLGAVARHVPVICFTFIAAGIVAVVVTRICSCWIMLGAQVAFMVGNTLLATLDPDLLYWKQLFWTVVVMPFGIDASFPAASLMLSNLVPKKHQGVAAGLLTTTANYSIALGLGFAGTVEAHYNDGGKDLLRVYRSALWTGVGLAGAGFVISAILTATGRAVSSARPNLQDQENIKATTAAGK